MDDWKRAFVGRLDQVASRWIEQFNQALESAVVPVYDDLAEFLRDHGFRASAPLREEDRRSFKFELTENAYLLMIFRFTAVGSFELHRESFVPGQAPRAENVVGRVIDLDEAWAKQHFHDALDAFVDHLAGKAAQPAEEPAPV